MSCHLPRWPASQLKANSVPPLGRAAATLKESLPTSVTFGDIFMQTWRPVSVSIDLVNLVVLYAPVNVENIKLAFAGI